MSIVSKAIGILMIIIGFLGVVTRVPDLYVSALVDNINPLAQFGIIVPFIGTQNSTQSLLLYVIISFLILLIGVVIVTRGGRKNLIKK